MQKRPNTLLSLLGAASILLGAVLLGVSRGDATAKLARIVVYTQTVTGDPAEEADMAKKALDVAGSYSFFSIGEYSGKVLVKGPTEEAGSLLSRLADAGLEAETAADLDTFSFHGLTIDSDLGPLPGKPLDDSGGSYFLTLDGYARDEWLLDLRSQVSIVRPLGGAAYVVFAAPGQASVLKKTIPWIRSVFRVENDSKKYGFEWSFPDSSPYRPVAVAVAAVPESEAVQEFLIGASAQSIDVDTDESGANIYQAWLSDVDINAIAQMPPVFEIGALASPTTSGERPAQLIARAGNGATLPAANLPKYVDWLQSAGFDLSNAVNRFYNTTVGVIDTGFDTGDITYANIHPDFRYVAYQGSQVAVVVAKTSGIAGPLYDDRDNHGTVVASIIAGYPASSRVEAGGNGYQYGLGLAPTVRLVTDKYFNCGLAGGTYQDATLRVIGAGANVINMSFNDPGSQGGCDYTAGSAFVDSQTRTGGRLFVVAAGNSPEGCTNNYVRSPGTAKNAIAAGSTDNYTLSAWINVNTANSCAWNALPRPYAARCAPDTVLFCPRQARKPCQAGPGCAVHENYRPELPWREWMRVGPVLQREHSIFHQPGRRLRNVGWNEFRRSGGNRGSCCRASLVFGSKGR